MRILRSMIGACGLVALGLTTAFAGLPGGRDRSHEVKRVTRAAEVVDEIMKASDKAIPSALLEKAECVAVIPGMGKGGFVVGADYGKGVVMCRRNDRTWSPPAFIQIGGGSLGWQAGFEKIDLVAIIMNRHGMEQLLGDKFTIGADASATAGPVGRTTSADTDAKMDAEILTYSRAKGVFAGISLNGVVVKPDIDGNRAFYGAHKDISAREILRADGTGPMPAEAAPLEGALTRATIAAKD